MRDVYEVLGEKKNAVERLRREVAALRSVAWLVDETDTISNVPAQTDVCVEAASDTISRHREALRTAAQLLADDPYDLADRIRSLRASPAQPITRGKPKATSPPVIERTRGQTVPTSPRLVPNISRGPAATSVARAQEPPVSGLAQSEPSWPTSSNTASVPSLFSLDEYEKETTSGTRYAFIIAMVCIIVIAVLVYLGSRQQKTRVDVPASNAVRVQQVPIAAQPTTHAATPSKIARQSPALNKVDPSTKFAGPERMEGEPIQVKPDLRAAEAKGAPADQASPPAPLNLADMTAAADQAVSNLVAGTPVSPPKPEVLNISQGVTQGLILKRVQPVYPPQALTTRIEGSVMLQATISRGGDITNVKAISGPSVLSRAAMAAVRQWRYKPYFLNGEPVEIQTQIAVNFRLPK
jgi:TonB family protein